MDYKIILIINRNTNMKVCEHYCYKSILLDECNVETGLNLKIVYEGKSFFTHEMVEKVEPFEEYGLKITTTKKTWFIHG